MAVWHLKNTIRLLYPVRVVLLGLAVAQFIGTLLVRHSNLTLAQKLIAVKAAGYSQLPGMHLEPPLTSWTAALSGGLFFTLSTGAGIVLLCLGASLLIESIPARYRRTMTLVLVLVWLFSLLWANSNGLSYGSSAFLIFLPGPVIWAARAWSPWQSGTTRLPWRRTIHFLLIALLAACWLPRVDADVFINIKDNLLLTTRPGIKTVHLYYQHTLYPAEVFKSLSQKQIKTCTLINIKNSYQRRKIEKIMSGYGYFAVPEDSAPIDLTVRNEDGHLVLSQPGRKTVQITDSLEKALWPDNMADTLASFSVKTDNNRVLRKFTLYLLLGVAPLVLYLISLTAFSILPGIFLSLRLSSWLVPVLCCLFWTAAIFYIDTPFSHSLDKQAAGRAIQDGSRKERLAALRYIYRQKLDIADFAGAELISDEADFALTYWLLKNYGHSRHPTARQFILTALKSDSAYTVCKAIEALAIRGKKLNPDSARRLLVAQLTSSTNWYTQFYAYKSARELGWNPEK